MTQAYSNVGGTGLRCNSLVALTTSAGFAGANQPKEFIDGITGTGGTWFFNGATTYDLIFDFGSARVVDEAKWHQSNASTHGTWKFQGSNTSATGPWTDIGSSFTLGGATTQTITAINGNTTAYRYLKLVQTGVGVTSNSPFIHEIEFKIDDNYPTGVQTYHHAKGAGDRTGVVTLTGSHAPASGTYAGSLDNNVSTSWSMNTGSTSLKFDFGSAVICDECLWWTSNGTTQGNWQWAGSNDDASYTNIGASFTLGGGTISSRTTQTQTELAGNTTAYRYYKLTYVSGSRSAVPSVPEIMFRLQDGVAPGSTRRRHSFVGM